MKIKITIIFIAMGLLFSFLSSDSIIKYYLIPKIFDSVEWKDSYIRFQNFTDPDGTTAYKEFSERKKMVYNLIRSNVLVGKNKQEVINLLGLDGNKQSDNNWIYWLDFTSVDNKWLEIKFNRQGFVVEFNVTED